MPNQSPVVKFALKHIQLGFSTLQKHGPETLPKLLDDLTTIVVGAEYPRLTVRVILANETLELGEEYDFDQAFFTCPHCGNDNTTVQVMDVGFTTTIQEELTPEDIRQRQVGFVYDEHPDMDKLVYLSSCCALPVRLPEGWTEGVKL